MLTGEARGPVLPLQTTLRHAAFSPDGRALVTVSGEGGGDLRAAANSRGWIECWDWQKGESVFQPVQTAAEPRAIAFSPDGKHLVAACADGAILILDPRTGMVQNRLAHPNPRTWYLYPLHLVFHPRANWFVVGGLGNQTQIIDASSGRVLHTLRMTDWITTVDFSPDGRWLAAGSANKEVRFWNVQTGQQDLKPLVHPDWVFEANFSADGRYLLTAGRDGMARLWDWPNAALLQTLEHPDEVYNARFFPDGRHAFTLCRDGASRLWELQTGRLLSPAQSLATQILRGGQPQLTQDGQRLAVGALAVFDLGLVCQANPQGLSQDDLLHLGQILSGQTIGPGGRLMNLTSQDWLDSWKQFRRAHPDYPGLSLAPAEPAPPGARE